MGILKIQYLPQYTIDDYRSWEGEWELIHGIPYAMSPSPTSAHQRAGMKTILLLESALKESSCNCEVFYDLDWHVKADTVVRPDILVLCGKRLAEDFVKVPPSLIVEILSPSTVDKDRTLKADLYAEAGVPNYIMIDHLKKEVEILLLAMGKYQINKSSSLKLDDCEIIPDWSRVFDEGRPH